MGSGKFAEPRSWTRPEWLLGEVRDVIDRLNDHPDSTGRCLDAADAFLANRSDERREELLAACLAIPEHLRVYALGDMDRKDWPLQVIAVGVGGALPGDGRVVTEPMHEGAVAYFEERAAAIAEHGTKAPADGPHEGFAPAVTLPHLLQQPMGDPAGSDLPGLRNDYPAPITVSGTGYATVTHAYWALSTDDEEHRAAVAAAGSGYHAGRAAEQAPRRPGWETARVAVMAGLLRAKFAQHLELAEILLGTGDASLVHAEAFAPFWEQAGSRGRNWIGRLLELVRAELAAERAGISV